MICLLVFATLAQGQDPIVPVARPGIDGRGRDPWVFRGIFEDRTRMLLIAPRANWWMAFNPETGAMHKVWQGKMDFRGKVWDFSQDNSRAEGKIYFAAPSEIWRLPGEGTGMVGWKTSGLTSEKGVWTFGSATSEIVSIPTDLTDWHRVFVAFDETGKKGRFRVDVSGTQPQWFTSTTSVGGENDWQWNFKRIERPEKDTVIKITTQVAGKKLRNLRMYGDKGAWFDSKGRHLEVLWDGYTLIDRTRAVDIRIRLKLASGKLVKVSLTPDLRSSNWFETYNISDLPKGESIILRREGLSPSVKSNLKQGSYVFDRNGTQELNFEIQEASK